MVASSLVLLTSCAVYADTSIDWYFNWGMFPQGTSLATLQNVNAPAGTGVAASQAVMWQLIYAGSDNNINAVDASNSGSGYVSGDDVVVSTRNIPVGGGTYGEWLYSIAGQSAPFANVGTLYDGSTFYQRVIGTASPVVGDWYYNSPKLVAIDSSILGFDQNYDGNTDSVNQGDALNIQIVPEPSSMALLAIGLGVVALRRKFRS